MNNIMYAVEYWLSYIDDESLETIQFDTIDEALAFIADHSDSDARLVPNNLAG